MNRIDEIKERLQTEFYVFTEEDTDGEPVIYTEAQNDISYLLSLNERMKLALEEISTYKEGNALVHVTKLKDIAIKALEE